MAELGQWWKDAIVYQVYLRSFADGNGDGVGDFVGLRERLPHLAELGVDAIWLNPFYPSPMADGGYDVSDYRDVDPRFGTLADADALIRAAAAHDIRVIVDIVPNHCSIEHPWFRDALRSGPGGPERRRFHFRDGGPDGSPPNNWQSMFGGPAWTRVEDGQWYLHLWDSSQPDFNWDDPAVPAMFEDVLRFWLDRGVAGFRVDAALGLYKAEGLPDLPPGAPGVGPDSPYMTQPALFELYRGWRKLLDSYPADVFPGRRAAVLEAWYDDRAVMAPFMEDGQLHQVFNLGLVATPWQPAELRASIDFALDVCAGSETAAPWVLENHDSPRLATRMGVDQALIRNPTPEVMRGEVRVDAETGARRARAAALLLLALPGSAYVYQGQELGLFEVLDIPADRRQDPIFALTGGLVVGRDGCRIPLPWSGGTAPYGFSESGSPWLPQPEGWAGFTREAQSDDLGSPLSLYRAAIKLRREHPALGDGELAWADTRPDLLMFTREPGFVFVANFGSAPALLPPGDVILTSVPVEDGLLPPDAAAWISLP
ncbi:alpha-amylase family glycosyl hydrolase [Actinocorallia longicatena]|uniref:Glycoside hydrolase family 13 protein n=1 Tax=Actinocorallia longicatena TaxID=111803 RepID=A0ABP6QA32_9ACTN